MNYKKWIEDFKMAPILYKVAHLAHKPKKVSLLQALRLSPMNLKQQKQKNIISELWGKMYKY